MINQQRVTSSEPSTSPLLPPLLTAHQVLPAFDEWQGKMAAWPNADRGDAHGDQPAAGSEKWLWRVNKIASDERQDQLEANDMCHMANGSQ